MNNTIEQAEKLLKRVDFWSRFNWILCSWLSIFSIFLSAAVPFGLAMLLYIPQEHQNRLNIALLIISVLAFAIQLVLDRLKLEHRTVSVRESFRHLYEAIPLYKDEAITNDEFIEKYRVALDAWQNQRQS